MGTLNASFTELRIQRISLVCCTESVFPLFFLKMGQSRPLFCLFSSFSHYNFNNRKKHRWCAWDSNPGLQDGRRRRNQGAMAATRVSFI